MNRSALANKCSCIIICSSGIEAQALASDCQADIYRECSCCNLQPLEIHDMNSFDDLKHSSEGC